MESTHETSTNYDKAKDPSFNLSPKQKKELSHYFGRKIEINLGSNCASMKDSLFGIALQLMIAEPSLTESEKDRYWWALHHLYKILGIFDKS